MYPAAKNQKGTAQRYAQLKGYLVGAATKKHFHDSRTSSKKYSLYYYYTTLHLTQKKKKSTYSEWNLENARENLED